MLEFSSFAVPLCNPPATAILKPMTRFAPRQADLFAAPPAEPEPSAPEDPLAEILDLLAQVRDAERLPWPDAAAAMAAEHRVLGLGRRAGPEGEALAAAFLAETERLLALTD